MTDLRLILGEGYLGDVSGTDLGLNLRVTSSKKH